MIPAPASPTIRAARVLATWFGCGLIPFVPGTLGTLAALPLWLLLRDGGPWVVLAAALIVTLTGIWSAGVVARASTTKDPQIVVIDEVAGVLVALAGVPQSTRGIVGAVLLFRIFDTLKPFPARHAERLPGGWGIVTDDVVAGLQTIFVLRGLEMFGLFP